MGTESVTSPSRGSAWEGHGGAPLGEPGERGPGSINRVGGIS